MAELLVLHARVQRRELLRALGYPRDRPPSPAVANRLDALWHEAASLVRARGAFCRIGQDAARSLGVPSPTAQVAVAVCTIGPALETRSQQLGDEGDPLGSLILDAYGSEAAESAAEALQACVCGAVQELGWSARRRLSPGYGTWPLARQPELLALLPTEALGIRLTDGCMMVPRKSVSFAAMLGEPELAEPRARCAACDLVDCRYRRTGSGHLEDEDR